MKKLVWAMLAALAVSALALTAANTALAQQSDPPPQFEDQAERNAERMQRRRTDRERDDFGSMTDPDSGPLCSAEDALAGRCIEVARLPRCPGDPRCPDPTRARPDTETHE